MSLSVIPLTILGQITGVSGSGDTVLYQVSFKSIDGTPLYGVIAVWTDEQAEIEALAAQKPYGVWINPVDGTFTVKFAGYTYVGSADLSDADVLAGVTPIEFANQSGGGSGLPEVTDADNGKMLKVEDGEWEAKQYPVETVETSIYSGTVTLVSTPVTIPGVSAPANIEDAATYDVKVNGNTLEWYANDDSYGYSYDDSGTGTYYACSWSDGSLYLTAEDTSYNVIAGDYQVSITNVAETVDENFAAGVQKVLPEIAEIVYLTLNTNDNYYYPYNNNGELLTYADLVDTTGAAKFKKKFMFLVGNAENYTLVLQTDLAYNGALRLYYLTGFAATPTVKILTRSGDHFTINT